MYEKRLVYGKNPAGVMFALKVGMGWRDSDPPKNDVQLDEAGSFSEKIKEVNRLYLMKKS